MGRSSRQGICGCDQSLTALTGESNDKVVLVQLLFYLLSNVRITHSILFRAVAIPFQTRKNRIGKYVDYAADYELKFKRIVSKIFIYIKCSYRSQTTTIFNSLKQARFSDSVF